MVKSIFPDLIPSKLKGENGCIGVIGGSLEFTGAPFYSAVSSLKTGADLAHVFCHKEAAVAIKSYSPELIVHPAFEDSTSSELFKKTLRWLKLMSSLTIGPGLGRDESMHKIFLGILEQTKDSGVWHILDADSLFFFINNKKDDVIKQIINPKQEKECNFIFTPNNGEFQRLCAAFCEDKENINSSKDLEDYIFTLKDKFEDNILEITDLDGVFEREVNLARLLGYNIIVKKGIVDVITDGRSLILVGNQGSNKRCGGIGDILTGVISSFISLNRRTGMDIKYCIASASYICRRASYIAYQKHWYSLTAPNVIEELGGVLKTFR